MSPRFLGHIFFLKLLKNSGVWARGLHFTRKKKTKQNKTSLHHYNVFLLVCSLLSRNNIHGLCVSLQEMKRSYSVKFYNKIQSLPRLTLLSSNDECDSVARDGFILGVFIALVVDVVDVAGSVLSGVVWETEMDEEMAKSTDIKGWFNEPAKPWYKNFRKYIILIFNYNFVITMMMLTYLIALHDYSHYANHKRRCRPNKLVTDIAYVSCISLHCQPVTLFQLFYILANIMYSYWNTEINCCCCCYLGETLGEYRISSNKRRPRINAALE